MGEKSRNNGLFIIIIINNNFGILHSIYKEGTEKFYRTGRNVTECPFLRVIFKKCSR